MKRKLEFLIALVIVAGCAGILISRRFPPARETPRSPNGEETSKPVSAEISIPVLCYHRFERTAGPMVISPERFEEHLKWLKERGYATISLADLERFLSGRHARLPEKPFLITVDDGYRSFLDHALPLLERYGFSAALFVYPESISRGKAALTWEELKTLVSRGIEVGSHSFSHANLTALCQKLPADAFQTRLIRELAASRRVMERVGFRYERDIIWAGMPHVLYRLSADTWRRGAAAGGA